MVKVGMFFPQFFETNGSMAFKAMINFTRNCITGMDWTPIFEREKSHLEKNLEKSMLLTGKVGSVDNILVSTSKIIQRSLFHFHRFRST